MTPSDPRCLVVTPPVEMCSELPGRPGSGNHKGSNLETPETPGPALGRSSTCPLFSRRPVVGVFVGVCSQLIAPEVGNPDHK